jgi:hypothetical protein
LKLDDGGESQRKKNANTRHAHALQSCVSIVAVSLTVLFAPPSPRESLQRNYPVSRLNLPPRPRRPTQTLPKTKCCCSCSCARGRRRSGGGRQHSGRVAFWRLGRCPGGQRRVAPNVPSGRAPGITPSNARERERERREREKHPSECNVKRQGTQPSVYAATGCCTGGRASMAA